ncbi:MAG: ABC transporter permease [Clostridia bacterium]|nr:ABC transporter permease [Clostridia bacterium]
MDLFVFIFRNAIFRGTPLLFGAVGETITEKSGNLNLGIPGIMSVGAISGFIGAYFYNNAATKLIPFLAVFIPLIACIIGSVLASLIYAFLTVTLRANQNVSGLALTTFGVGVLNFFGESLGELSGADTAFVTLTRFPKYFKTTFPFAKKLGWFGEIFLSYGFLVYLAIIIAIVASFFLKKTKVGLHLRAVGENPATADAAGINVTLYKYVSTCIGGAIAGLGGLYYIMDISDAIWRKDLLGEIGWLAIALVIFTLWKPTFAIAASFLFGGLLSIGSALTINTRFMPLIDMIPYVMTIVLLIVISIIDTRENQPPASLGNNYFREDR